MSLTSLKRCLTGSPIHPRIAVSGQCATLWAAGVWRLPAGPDRQSLHPSAPSSLRIFTAYKHSHERWPPTQSQMCSLVAQTRPQLVRPLLSIYPNSLSIYLILYRYYNYCFYIVPKFSNHNIRLICSFIYFIKITQNLTKLLKCQF